jgi:hypothetical protein
LTPEQAAQLCLLLSFSLELTRRFLQHARPYRAIVHDLAGLQRNVSCILVVVVQIVNSLQVVTLEQPRMGSTDWSVAQASDSSWCCRVIFQEFLTPIGSLGEVPQKFKSAATPIIFFLYCIAVKHCVE